VNVLLVDDSAANLTIYKAIVRNQTGCIGVPFTSSGDALDWCANNELAIALVDYDMPEPNGLEFIQRFRRLPNKGEVPIVMITGEEDRALRYKALEAGANDFLKKPIDVVECSARVHNMLELYRSRRKLENRALWLAEEVKKGTAEVVARERETIMRLARTAEYRDTGTGLHVVRMAHYAAAIGAAAGFSEREQELLLLAAPMHDIGKVAIPDSILLKPGKLDAAEISVMQQHTVIGHAILKDSTSMLLQKAAEIALTHHEKFDGSGYPHCLAAHDIPVAGRICAISDVFDALTSARPYKEAWSVDAAIAEITGRAATHFDPSLVDAFISVLPQILLLKAEHSDGSQSAPPSDHGAVPGRLIA
jgi:response regulator RpfG family c-di-GMP phosphodiesterase